MRWLLVLLASVWAAEQEAHLTTDDEGYLTVIQGFATQLQCIVDTCSPDVIWYKDDVPIFNGTTLVSTSPEAEHSYKLQHKISVNYEAGCSGECSDISPCPHGQACIDNQCCACSKEDYTLVLKNLTLEDSGRYKCQLANQSELLEFQLDVLESGLKNGFHENISYDHSQCCQEKGISPTCQAMCKPSEMATHHFDPTSCKTADYKNFLTCATENGTRSHVHCCKTQLVPSFCYDFCSGNFQMLRRSHRLCLYYLPEIFECYNRAYLPYPDPPEDVEVNAVDHDKLSVCWSPPPIHDSNKMYPITGYTVSYKEIPNFPLFAGELGLPQLSSDYLDLAEPEGPDSDYEESEDPIPDEPTTRSPKREKRELSTDEAEFMDSVSIVRKKRQMSIIVMTSDPSTNTSHARTFGFEHINTTETCLTINNLRASTRYIVVVTSMNDYGVSIPSVRSLVSTNTHVFRNNDTVPDVMKCCETAGVSKECAEAMCRTSRIPNATETINISTVCRNEWPKVSPCVADQRNHTECCLAKNVQQECLPICAGSSEALSIHSILCLNLDLHVIYQCLREGYENRPSPPINLTVHEPTETTAVFTWADPVANAHLVQTYTLFIKKLEHGASVRQVHNAVSPHTELGLDPDTEYTVAVQSNSKTGSSLPSTELIFSTKPVSLYLCRIGEPLLEGEGRLYMCSHYNKCPPGYFCNSYGDDMFCCPEDPSHSDANFQECCLQNGVSAECMSSCYFNSTLPVSCKSQLNKWVQCASEGSDHSRCCEQEGVPKHCMTGCRHPFQVPDNCYSDVSRLAVCFAGRHDGLPSAVKNLKVTLIQHDSATLSWEDLDNDVILFNVDLFHNGGIVNSTNITVSIIRLENLQPQTKYSARVTAFNNKGPGTPSWNISFSTFPDLETSDSEVPRQPEGLRVVWNHGTRVNITWEPVQERRSGKKVEGPVDYTLYYVAPENQTQWSTIRSNNSWAVMTELKRDALYSVYATATEGNQTSRSSSVITIIAQPDSFGLPEPLLIFTPDNDAGVYVAGDKITINCSLPVPLKQRFNIDLSIGNLTYHNDDGKEWVMREVEADSSLDTISCGVTDSDGRQTTSMKHVLVKFGPVAIMEKTRIPAFDDGSVDIVCTVKGFPPPQIRFEKGGNPVSRYTRLTVRTVQMNTYRAILHIPNVTNNDDHYTCIAEQNGNVSVSKSTEIVIAKEHLPVNPRFFLTCCENEKIEGECMQACTVGSTPTYSGNCSQYAQSYLKCAYDVRDHSDCCAYQGVPRKCLPLCSGDTNGDSECNKYATKILGCYVRGHEGSPSTIRDLSYEKISSDTVKVKWQGDRNPDNYQYYAVYYKKKTDHEDDFKMSRTRDNYFNLEIENGVAYDVAVLAANANGHSPIAFLDLPGKEAKTSSGGHGIWWITILLIICAIVIINLYILGRRREFPPPLGKLLGSRGSAQQPTVAFENPAYVSGQEVEIRGLGRAEWQNQELQSADEEHRRGNGNHYSKLESA